MDIIEIAPFIVTFYCGIMALAGWGMMECSILFPGKDRKSPYNVALYGVFGLITLYILGTIINLFFPITDLIAYGIIALGCILFLLQLRRLKIQKKILIGYTVLSAYIIGLFLLFRQVLGDTGFYHIQAVKWITLNPTPYGLANLYPQLGFNSSWNIIGSFFERGLFQRADALFITNGILLFFFLTIVGQILLQDERLQRFKKEGIFSFWRSYLTSFSGSEIFILIVATIPVIKVSRDHLSSLSYDFPVFLLTVICFALIIRIIEEPGRYDRLYTFAVVISLFTVTIKLSALVLPAFVFTVPIFQKICSYMRKHRQLPEAVPSTSTQTFPLFAWLISAVVLLTPLCIRGVILSGNLFFPFSLTRVPGLSWAVPYETELKTSKEVTAYARLPEDPHFMDSLNNWDWISPWATKFFHWETFLLLCMAFAVLQILLWLYYSPKHRGILLDSPCIPAWYPLLGIIAGIVFWFILGPETRFGFGSLYALPVFLISYPYIRLPRPYPRIFQATQLLILALCILISVGYIVYNTHDQSYIRIEKIPDVAYTIGLTENAVQVNIPTDAPYMNYTIPWNLPLPATTSLNPDLQITIDPITHEYIRFEVRNH